MIVPGNNGETLADQTCCHFPTWLDDIVASEVKGTVIWMFHHDIRIDSLASWFAYCEAGERLLQALTNMQKDDGMVRMSFRFSDFACTDSTPSQMMTL